MAVNNVIGDAWIEIHGKTDKLREDIEKFFKLDNRTRRNIEKNLQDSLDKVFEEINYEKMSDVKIKVDIDTEDALEQINALRELIRDEIETINVRVNVDNDSLNEVQALGDLVREQVEHVQIVPVLNKERAEETEDDLDEVAKDRSAQVSPDYSSLAGEYVSARLTWLSRPRVVEFYTKLNNNSVIELMAALSGTRMLQNTMDTLSRIILHLDESIPKLSMMVGGITYVGGLLTSLVGDASSLIVDIGRMVGLLIPLPGLMFGFVAGFGLTVAALKDWNEIFPDFKDQMADLQDTISERFWDRAKQPIEELIDTLLPMLTGAFADTSTVLGGFFGTLATEVTETLGPSFDFMFGNLNKSILISQLSLDSFVHLMDTLGRHGSEYLPDLARWFGNITQSFDEWVTAAEERGDLKKWTDQAVDNLGYLGDAIWQTGRIFYGLGVAAEEGGGATLKTFAGGLRAVADVVNSEPFSSKITQVFTSANEMISDIARVSGPAFKAVFGDIGDLISHSFETLGNSIGLIVREISQGISSITFKEGFKEMIDGISRGFEGMAPYIEIIFDGLGSLMPIIGSLGENFLPILGKALGIVSEVLIEMEDEIIALIEGFSGMLSTILDLPTPILAIGAGLIGMSGGIVNVVVGLGTLLPKLGAGATAISAFRAALVGGSGLVGATTASAGAVAALGTSSTVAAGATAAAGTGITASLGSAIGVAGGLATAAVGLGAAVVVAAGLGVKWGLSLRKNETDINIVANSLTQIKKPTDNASKAIIDMMTTTNKFGNSTTATGKEIKTLGDAVENFGAGAAKTFADGWSGIFSDLGIADEAFREQAASLDSAFVQMIANGNVEEARLQFERFSQAAIDNGATVEEVTDLFSGYAEAINEVDAAEAIAAEEAHQRALDQKRAVMDNSIDTASEYLEINRTIANELMGFKDAELDFAESVLEVANAFEANNGALSSNTQAGIDNQRYLMDFLSSSQEAVQSLVDQGASQERINEVMGQTNDSLDILAQKFGVSREAIDEYAESIGMAPEDYNLNATTNIAEELGKAAYEINGFLLEYSNGEILFNGNTLPAEATLGDFISEVGTEEGTVSINGQDFDARTTVEEFTDWLYKNDANIPVNAETKKAISDMNAMKSDWESDPVVIEAEAALELAEAQDKMHDYVREWNGKQFETHLLTDVLPAQEQVNTFMSQIELLAPVVEVDADATPAEAVVRGTLGEMNKSTGVMLLDADERRAKAALDNRIRETGRSTGVMKIDAQDRLAKDVADERYRLINALKPAITIKAQTSSDYDNTIYKAVARATKTAVITVKARTMVADGGLFPAVKAFASGGVEKHIAQIANPSSLIRYWAEPETGGEAYIPLALSKRNRSLEILDEVAKIFGYMLIPNMKKFADGGLLDGLNASSSNATPLSTTSRESSTRRGVNNTVVYNISMEINASDLEGIRSIEQFVQTVRRRTRQGAG